jgi:hypothetical protein
LVELQWAGRSFLAYVSGSVDQEALLRNEYLLRESGVLRFECRIYSYGARMDFIGLEPSLWGVSGFASSRCRGKLAARLAAITPRRAVLPWEAGSISDDPVKITTGTPFHDAKGALPWVRKKQPST